MKINEPRCDYLRLTTFDRTAYDRLAKMIADIHPAEDPEPGKFLQYEGDWYSHGFHGQGEQNSYLHWLAQISGELSQFWLDSCIAAELGNDVKATRLDLQVTVPQPSDWDIRCHVDALRHEHWPNRRRKVEFYENDGPGGTIYIGSRQSNKFARLYVKFTGHDKWPFCLRFEIELKKDVADIVYKTLVATASSPAEILRGEFTRLPVLESSTWLLFERALPVTGLPATLPVDLPDENKTIRWLLQKVNPTIKRMLNSHEHGYRTREWLKGLLDEHVPS